MGWTKKIISKKLFKQIILLYNKYMQCSVCYDSFMFPKTEEELKILKKKYYKESLEKLDKAKLENNQELEDQAWDEIFIKQSRFNGLIITNKHNSTYKCITDNCNSIICGDCLERMKSNGKDCVNTTDDDEDNSNRLIKCPYCRSPAFKEYMNNVFFQLKWNISKKNNDEDFFKDLCEDIEFF